MIVQNDLGNAMLWLVRKLNRRPRIRGFILVPWLIFIHTSVDLQSRTGKGIVVHERTHAKQMIRMFLVGFYVRYLFDWLKAGCQYSRELPLEKEAYQAQERYLR